MRYGTIRPHSIPSYTGAPSVLHLSDLVMGSKNLTSRKHVAARQAWQAAERNESLILAALSWLRSLGDVPSLIVGDFNLALSKSSVEPVLAMAGWSDVLEQAGPTCIAGVLAQQWAAIED